MRHLTPADYTTQPWANGRGTTIEMLRADAADGSLLWRLSIAMVVEDGPFSVFPGIDRSLTVIEGPGFDLAGDVALRCAPLVPVTFPGDVAVRAAAVTMPCRDFNVMTARGRTPARVRVIRQGLVEPGAGGVVAVFAPGPAAVDDVALAALDLIVTRDPVTVRAGPVLAVWIEG